MPQLDNARHEAFCQEYLVDGNGGRAYERAGYTATGNAAETAAARLFRNVQVTDRITELQAARGERVQVTVDDVFNAIWAEAQGMGIDSTPSARVSALKLAAQHMGMLVKRVETTEMTDLSTNAITDARRKLKERAERLGDE